MFVQEEEEKEDEEEEGVGDKDECDAAEDGAREETPDEAVMGAEVATEWRRGLKHQ